MNSNDKKKRQFSGDSGVKRLHQTLTDQKMVGRNFQVEYNITFDIK